MPKWNSPEHKLGRKEVVGAEVTEGDWDRVMQQADFDPHEREVLQMVKDAGPAGLITTAIQLPGGARTGTMRNSASIYQTINRKLKQGPNPDLGLSTKPYRSEWPRARIYLSHKEPKDTHSDEQ